MFRAEGARQILCDFDQNFLQIYSKTRAEGAPKIFGVLDSNQSGWRLPPYVGGSFENDGGESFS